MQKRLLQTLRDDPALPALLQTLQPAALARLVVRVGLNDAGELMALAPTRKLLQALDESLWKSPQPGSKEIFDPHELVDWLEAWNEIGDEFVADRLAAMSDEYRAMCLSHLVRVGIRHTLAFLDIPDDEVDVERDTLRPIGSCMLYGPYLVTPEIDDAWEVITTSLDAMWVHCPEVLLHTLGQLDGESRRRLTIDVAYERERQREQQGYVTGPGAGAFLLFIGITSIDELATLDAYDEETRRHLAAFAATADIEEPTEEPQLQRLRTVLEQEDVLIPQDTLLLTDQSSHERVALTELLTELAEADPSALERCARELAYLANVLKLGVRVRGATMSDLEARDAAYAACNRGLIWMREHDIEPHLAQEPGLIRLFALGWKSARATARGVS